MLFLSNSGLIAYVFSLSLFPILSNPASLKKYKSGSMVFTATGRSKASAISCLVRGVPSDSKLKTS